MPIREKLAPRTDEPGLGFRMADRVSGPRTARVLDFMEASWVGGPAKNLIEFATRAASLKEASLRPNVAVATFHRGGSPASNEFILACQRAGLEVHAIQERYAFDVGVIGAVRELIASYDPEIIQTHSVKSHFLVRLSGGYRQRCWIAFHHGYTWTNPKVRVLNHLDRWSLPAATQVVTVCRPFASSLERIGIDSHKIAVHHNSVRAFLPSAADRVVEVRRDLRIPADSQVLLNVGRLSREKGQSDLIEAVALLYRERSERDLRVVFVGYGPDGQRLKRLAKLSGMEERIIFAGHQADVSPFYTMADMMVLPSHTEGSPNTLLEAMAAGLPIVATCVGGVREIATDEKDALLVEKQNPGRLAGAIARVLSDTALRNNISKNARRTASAYSPEAYCNFMISLYKRCLANGKNE